MRFIKYLKAEKTIDFQISRAYLEISLLYILTNEKFKLKHVMKDFAVDLGGNPYKEKEYTLCENLQKALAPADGMSDLDQDWA